MIDWILIAITMGIGGGDSSSGPRDTAQQNVVETAQTEAIEQTAAALVAEPQVATGKFTTAIEVKPILTMTKPQWVALRDYNGQDLLYVTQIMAWRCGLLGMRIAVNGQALEPWELPPCHADTNSPNAILAEDGLPYKGFAQGSVDTITVELTYDDLTTDTATYMRKAVLMP